MKKHIICMLFTIMSVSLSALPSSAVQAFDKVVYVLEGEKIRYYRGARIRYYPNHIIIADLYNRQVIWEIVELAKSLGWDTVYIQDVPRNLRSYTIQYLSDNRIILNEPYVEIESNCGSTCGY